MADRSLLSSCSDVVLPHSQKILCSSPSGPLNSHFTPGSSSPFLGQRTMVCFEDYNEGNNLERSFICSFDGEGNVDEDLDEYMHQPEKKRRLTSNQVHFLERSFEEENKLEPERKVQLARDLGLQPRQVAIWFQNRRARWKTKQLEKDYDDLQTSYNKLKTDYESLLKEKDKLKAEMDYLSDKLLLKAKAEEISEFLDTKKLLNASGGEPVSDLCSEGEVSNISAMENKQEDLGSDRSDVFDSENLHYADRVHCTAMDPGDSSYAFEPDYCDISQDEDDNLISKSLEPNEYIVPKIEGIDYSDLLTSSCYFGRQVDDHLFGFWSY